MRILALGRTFSHLTLRVVRRVLLLDGARTEEEDIDSSPCALRLVWYGRHVGDADESTEQIEWVEVWTYVSALDGAIYQPIAHGMNIPCTCQSSVVISSKFTMRPPSSAFVAVTLPPIHPHNALGNRQTQPRAAS